ncbi:S8 family peptidase [Natronoglycomyces albus]|uniref:S8 family serine peptidase n=1 Tax=Natronoglycomyces albus TaxID=2811108 RepID=A0A895XGI6_9ACTN|nr:S8 family peptidase [Natronoglycomyces albus]QSB04971.1 S8 family serine peptidase [Natronoglycomyces albus]
MSKKTTLGRRLLAVAATGALAAGSFALITSPAHAEGNILGTDNPEAIEGSYIVTLKDGASTASAGSLSSTYDAEITAELPIINGFAAEMSEADAKRLAADSSVDFVEQDAIASVTSAGVQPNPPSWGLDRIDQVNLPLDNSYSYPNQGSGVTAYIFDSGMNLGHEEFTGRIAGSRDYISSGGNGADCNGHGTHVAGTVGGTRTGVAKNVDFFNIKVLDCEGNGPWSGTINGLQWVANNASGPSVVNMSLGGGFNQSVNNAVNNTVAAGVPVVVASGNSNANACNYSPASAQNALTVNNSTSSDARRFDSNFGSCTDLFAPGDRIYAPWIGGSNRYNTIGGTSMASPHVAGAAAMYLAENPSATPSQVYSAITSNASTGLVSNPGSGSPNRLLNIDFIGGSDPGDPEDEFSISLSPSSGTISAGESVTATLSSETTSGDAQEVTLSHSGAGSGVTVEFANDTLTTGNSTEVTFTASTNAPAGSHSITVTAAGSVERTAGYSLTVEGDSTPPECRGENSSSQTIHAGWIAASNIRLDCGSARGSVTVTVDVSHASKGELWYRLVGPNGASYDLKPFGSADRGTYTVNVGGKSGTYTLEVWNFSNRNGTLNGWSVAG